MSMSTMNYDCINRVYCFRVFYVGIGASITCAQVIWKFEETLFEEAQVELENDFRELPRT
jgi:hypothetical protein